MAETLAQWLSARLATSKHAPLVLDPAPRIAGAGEVLVAFGPAPNVALYAAVRHPGTSIRVGFAAKDRWINEEVEEAVESIGGDMNEFIEEGMEADEDLQFKVQHFHEAGWFHFASDVNGPPGFCDTAEGRDLIWYYLDGYARAILPVMAKAR